MVWLQYVHFRRLDKWIVFKQRGEETSIRREGGISEDKKSFFIKRLSTSPLGKTSPNQKAEKEKPITLVVAEERKEAGERKKKLGTQMAIWFRAIIDRATNNGTFETINQQLHTEASWFYSSHFEQNSYQNAE